MTCILILTMILCKFLVSAGCSFGCDLLNFLRQFSLFWGRSRNKCLFCMFIIILVLWCFCTLEVDIQQVSCHKSWWQYLNFHISHFRGHGYVLCRHQQRRSHIDVHLLFPELFQSFTDMATKVKASDDNNTNNSTRSYLWTVCCWGSLWNMSSISYGNDSDHCLVDVFWEFLLSKLYEDEGKEDWKKYGWENWLNIWDW